MDGVPSDLDLTFLHGAELVHVCIGQFGLQFRFGPAGSIGVSGVWEVFDADGRILDRGGPEVVHAPFQVHRLLGRRVVASEVFAPREFSLRFDDGARLRILDTVETHASYSIQPGDAVV